MIVCLGCGECRRRDASSRPGECSRCGDVSWTWLEDALRDPDGVEECIRRRARLAVARDLGTELLDRHLIDVARAAAA